MPIAGIPQANQKNKDPLKLDASENVFFERQVESVKATTYDKKYPNLKARTLIPVNFNTPQGAEAITYYQYDQVGVAKIVANYAKDFPRVSVKGKKFTSPVEPLGDSYAYTVNDIKAAAMANLNLEQREANAAKRAMMQLENKLAFFGDGTTGIPGFLSNVNVPETAVVADGSGASTLWINKSPDQILRDVNDMIGNINTITKGVEIANTVLLPLSSWNLIKRLRVSPLDKTTVLQALKEENPEITMWDYLNELETAGPGGEKEMVAYDRTPDALTLEIPWEFEQFPPQLEALEYVVYCFEKCGGTIVYYPLSINKAYGM